MGTFERLRGEGTIRPLLSVRLLLAKRNARAASGRWAITDSLLKKRQKFETNREANGYKFEIG